MFALPIAHLKGLKKQAGFTLIELLLVVAIISLLAVAVFAALNPSQRLKDTKDAKRTADVDTILTAIHQSIVDNKGALPTNLSGLAVNTETQLGTSNGTGGANPSCAVSNTSCTVVATACVDLMTNTQNLSPYLKTMPISPQSGATTYAATNTGYSVTRDTNGIITIKACGTEGASGISASR